MKYKKTHKNTLRFLREDEVIYNARKEDKLKPKKTFKLVDLFCGAGGMTLGFTKMLGHHFMPVWANDFNKYCVDTYNYNFGNHCVYGDIIDILRNKKINIPHADIVIGGPPCQGFSLLNRNRVNDPRNQLWRQFLGIVEKTGSKVFVIENVPQLLGTFEHGEILGTAEKMGFIVRSYKLCAADYGVPQTRWRAIIVGSKTIDPSVVFPPRKTHYKPGQKIIASTGGEVNGVGLMPNALKWRTVRDAIGSLPEPVGTEIRNVEPPLDLQFGRTPTLLSIKRYAAIPKEGMNRFDLQRNAFKLTPKCWIRKKTGGTDLFGRLWWDRPAFTIRTEFYKPEKGRYLHPVRHRPITHREAARLQSFPDDFKFQGTKIEIAKQIGNAVPPLMAARIADIAYLLLTAEK